MIKLGQKVRDKITGFTGLVTGKVEYITGCNQVLVCPPVKDDGTLVDSNWFDEQRIDVVEARPLRMDNSKANGPDKPAPKR